MIEVSELSKHYVLKESIIKAVDNVSLEVGKGEFVAVVGRSGSGKSTLLSLIAGLTKPTSGMVRIEGREVWRMSDGQQSKFRSEKIGFVFQFSSLIPSLNTVENVMYPAIFDRSRTDVHHRASELLGEVGLQGRIDSFSQQLSVGEQKRVAFARALINDPEIVLADEPTSELDVATEKEITQLLNRLHTQGLTMIVVTHNVELAKNADRALSMTSGILREFRKLT